MHVPSIVMSYNYFTDKLKMWNIKESRQNKTWFRSFKTKKKTSAQKVDFACVSVRRQFSFLKDKITWNNFFLKNISSYDGEYDLEQKIDLEIRIREGTTKLLAACKHQAQSLEAAKNLLTSNERMSAYMLELQRRKKDLPRSNLQPCKARVCLSDLRMPLIWRDIDHFKNKGDYRRFAVFCLARIGTEIYDTTLLCPVDRSLTDITFSDVLLFNNIPPDFEFRLEVYSHILQDDLSIASTPRKIKKTIHSSISRTVGKKLAASLKDELNSGSIGPKFELMATAKLTLDDVLDGIHTHDLEMQHNETRSNHHLPLFGHFCCRLAAQPSCLTQDNCSGEVHTNITHRNQLCAVWAQLKGANLEFWGSKEDANQGLAPLKTVTIDKDTSVEEGKKTDEIIISNDNDTMTLRTDDSKKWMRTLAQLINDLCSWRHVTDSTMQILSPGSVRQSFTKGFRSGSLYEQTPILESAVTEKGYQRPTIHDIFGLTPSTSISSCESTSSASTFRGRANSTRTSKWGFSSKDM